MSTTHVIGNAYRLNGTPFHLVRDALYWNIVDKFGTVRDRRADYSDAVMVGQALAR